MLLSFRKAKPVMKKKKPKVLLYHLILPLLPLLFSTVVFVLAKQFVFWRPHGDLSCALDLFVPFLPWTVVLYLGSFLYWYLSFMLALRQELDRAVRIYCAHVLTVLISFLFFVLMPTTLERPQVNGDGLWNWMLRLVYLIDTPENLFPSLHCSTGWLCWVGVRRRKDLPLCYRCLALPLSLLVCVSTLTTRQHVLADVIAGIALCELDYALAGIPRIRALFLHAAEPILRSLKKALPESD